MLLAYESILAPMLLALLSDMPDWKYATIVDCSNCNNNHKNAPTASSSLMGALFTIFPIKYFNCQVLSDDTEAKRPFGGNFIWLLSNRSSNIINTSSTTTMTMDETSFSHPSVIVTEGTLDWFENLYFRQDEEVYHIDLASGTLSEKFMIKNRKVYNLIGNFVDYSNFSSHWKYVVPKWFLRRSDLLGEKLKLLAEDYQPYTVINEPGMVNQRHEESISDVRPLNTKSLTGPFSTVMNYLREELNFTSSLWKSKDLDKLGGWGRPAKKGSENNTWSGLVGLVQRGEMDMCVTAFSMTLARSKAIDFIFPLVEYQLGLVIRDPGKTDFAWTAFIGPFYRNTWVCIFVMTMFAAILLEGIVALSLMRQKKSKLLSGSERISLSSFAHHAWFYFASNFGTKFHGTVSCDYHRVAIFIVLLMGNISFMAYKAALTSHLLAQKPAYPFESLEGLLDSDYYIITTANSSKEAKLRSASPSSIYGQLWSEKVLPHPQQSLVTDLSVAMERAWEDPFGAVYHDVNVIAANVPTNRRCEFVQPWPKPRINLTPASMIASPNSPLTPFLRAATIAISERAVYVRDLSRIKLRARSTDCVSHEMRSSGIGLDTIAALFVLVMFGGALGVVILLLEGIFGCAKPKDVTPEKDFQDKKIEILWNEIKREYRILYGEDLEDFICYSTIVDIPVHK